MLCEVADGGWVITVVSVGKRLSQSPITFLLPLDLHLLYFKYSNRKNSYKIVLFK
jgi:hypothetical protein